MELEAFAFLSAKVCLHCFRKASSTMKKIIVRKTQAVRLTSAATPLYGSTCGGKPILPY